MRYSKLQVTLADTVTKQAMVPLLSTSSKQADLIHFTNEVFSALLTPSVDWEERSQRSSQAA